MAPQTTAITPIGLAALALAVVLVFVLPRKWVVAPLLLFTFLVPLGEQFNDGGLQLFAHRILNLCGCLRMFRSSSAHRILAGGYNRSHKIF